jgi:hypothetical protein
MTYYVLAKKKERGCPFGMLSGFLFDEAAPKKTPEYGLSPWYANANSIDPVFAPEMFFNSKDKLYNFDLCVHHGHLIVSEQFKAVLCEFRVPFAESVPLKVVNHKSKNIGEKDYFLIRLAQSIYQDRGDVFEADMELLWDRSGSYFSISRASMKSDFDLPFFKLHQQNQNTFFCSGAFVSACEKIEMKGVNFLRLEDIAWKMETNDNLLDYLTELSPMLFIR